MLNIIVFWDLDDDPTGNVQHIADHGFSRDEVEAVLQDSSDVVKSRSSGRPIAFGHLPDGRYVAVVYEFVADNPSTVYPITAYEVPEAKRKRRKKR